jgi:hypothetical protein
MIDKDLNRRLDRIEEKLDKHLEQVSTNTADIQWIRGYVRLSGILIVSLLGGVATTIIKLFIN